MWNREKWKLGVESCGRTGGDGNICTPNRLATPGEVRFGASCGGKEVDFIDTFIIRFCACRPTIFTVPTAHVSVPSLSHFLSVQLIALQCRNFL